MEDKYGQTVIWRFKVSIKENAAPGLSEVRVDGSSCAGYASLKLLIDEDESFTDTWRVIQAAFDHGQVNWI